MEDMIKKVISFILFFVNAIKDMVMTLSGRKPVETETTEPVSE